MKIIKGKQPGAKKVIIYGPEGIGKSTFASRFPEPLFIDTEGSTKDLDVARTEAPSSWPMLMFQVQEAIQDHTVCQTLIIDTADWAEILCTNHVCANNQKGSIEEFGYGKGYVYLQEEFGKLLNRLSELVDSGTNVVLTAHAKMRKFEQPDELGAYDRWEMKLSKNVAPMVKEWADMVLFCNYKTVVVNVDGQGAQKGKNKAQGGKRVMYTTHHNCWDAKNRYGLPEECEFDYKIIQPVIEDQGIKKQNKPVAEHPDQMQQPDKKEEQKLPDFMKIPETVDEEVDFHSAAGTENKVPEAFQLPGSIPKALRDLMEANLVSEEELQAVVADKKYFPINTPIQNYPTEFVNGVLIGAWKQVYEAIKKMRESYQIPFDK